MKKTLFLSLLFLALLHSQTRHRKPGLDFHSVGPLFISNILILPTTDSSNFIYYTYSIPYSKLVFVRTGDEYRANLRVMVEVTDSSSQKLVRDSRESKVVVDNFDLTSSNTKYLQGFLKLNLAGKSYRISPVITDLNSQSEISLKKEEISAQKFEETKIYNPIVINSGDYYCGETKVITLSKFGRNIPFSPERYDLLIPVEDLEIEKLFLTITRNNDTLLTKTITDYFDLGLEINECDRQIVISASENVIPSRNFVLEGINEKLDEGPLTISVSKTGTKTDEKFNRVVFWANKPFSLRNPEQAIELLKFIENDKVIDDLLDKDEKEYPKALKDYWAQFDPSPENVYNPIMQLYYSRIDYAAKEFVPIGRENGVSTDRGKVYIRYGKPDKIERSSNEHGNVVETWIYAQQDMKFIFVDKKGTGSFTLIEG